MVRMMMKINNTDTDIGGPTDISYYHNETPSKFTKKFTFRKYLGFRPSIIIIIMKLRPNLQRNLLLKIFRKYLGFRKSFLDDNKDFELWPTRYRQCSST